MSKTAITKEPINDEHTPIIKKYRVQLDYSPEDFAKINALVKELRLGTRSDLYKNALLAFQWVYSKKKQGCTIVAITPEGRYLEPEFAFTQNIHPGPVPSSVPASAHGVELCASGG